MLLLLGSERLNALAGAHWRSFSSQNYFDTRGTFAGILWCGPLVLLLTAMLTGFLWRAGKLLVRVWSEACAACVAADTRRVRSQVRVKRLQARKGRRAHGGEAGDAGGEGAGGEGAGGAAATRDSSDAARKTARRKRS